MDSITSNLTLNYTKDLTVLYVEDDLDLQQQTKQFLDSFFQKVTVANNGEQALNAYKENAYDIVISDVKMPKMSGLELTQKIKELHNNQAIIIISAYHDSDDLLSFINLNIKYFVQKPMNFTNIIETLYSISKEIVNSKMVEEYRSTLEKNNQELTLKNEELQSLVRILDSKLLQIAQGDTHTMCDVDEEKAIIQLEHLKELKELEIDINGAIVLLTLSKNVTSSNIQALSSLLLSYATILNHYPLYSELCENITNLSVSLKGASDEFLNNLEEISTLLESFIYVLHLWREKVTHREFSKSFEFHSSMINDIVTIIDIIDDIESKN